MVNTSNMCIGGINILMEFCSMVMLPTSKLEAISVMTSLLILPLIRLSEALTVPFNSLSLQCLKNQLVPHLIQSDSAMLS